MQDEINAESANAVKQLLMKDSAKARLAEANALKQAEAAEAAASVAQMLGKDKAKQLLKEANELEAQAAEEAKLAAGANIAAQLAGSAKAEEAKRLAEQAAKEEAEANIQAALLSDQKRKVMEETKAAEEKLKEEELLNSMAGHMEGGQRGTIGRFRAAVEAGDEETATELAAHVIQSVARRYLRGARIARARRENEAKQAGAAASVLQNWWRIVAARRRTIKLRQQRDERMMEAATVRIQLAYRSRQARKKADKMREKSEALQQEASARKLQCAYRIRRSRKKMTALRAAREEKMMEWAACKIQACYRYRQARRRVAGLREEKHRLVMEAAARRIQCVFRARKARQHVKRLKRTREHDKESSAALRMQLVVRRLMARRIFARKKQQRKRAVRDTAAGKIQNRVRWNLHNKEQPIQIRLIGAKGLRPADGKFSDPFVFVSVSEREGSSRQQLAIAKSVKVNKNLNPRWNESVRVIRSTKRSRITLTVCDHDTFGKPDFLGQVSLRLGASHDKWETEITRPLDNFKAFGHARALEHAPLPLYPKQGAKQIAMDDLRTKPTGTITFKLEHLPVSKTMCGWADRKKLAWHGMSSKWTVVWAVLASNKLFLFDDPSEMNAKGDNHRETIKVADLTKMPSIDKNIKDQRDWEAVLVTDHKKRWQLHFRAEQTEWLHKLENAYFATHGETGGERRLARSYTVGH